MADVSWILLVEDDPDHRVLLREAIRRYDGEVALHEVSDFSQARSWLAQRMQGGRSVMNGAVMLDLGLPGPSGFALLEWLREIGMDAVPVFVLTASENPMDADHAFNLGARGYFQKPADFRQYVQILEQVFDMVTPPGREGRDGG
jgi:two-component system response regulator